MKSNGDWPVLRLADVCLKIQDGTHFSPKVQYSDPAPGRFKYITSKNIRPWGLDLSDMSYVAEETHQEIYGRCDPQLGDVLLTKDGANTGTVAVNTLDEPFSLLSSVAVLRPHADILDARFLRYFIESPQGSRNILGKMSGTAIRRIILRQIKDATIPLPPLDEQRQIVAEIEKQFTRLHAGVASLKRVQSELKRYRASVLKAASEGRLVPTEAELARKENRSYETGEQLLQRILKERREKWNGKGKYKEPVTPALVGVPNLPNGWTWANVDQLAAPEPNAIADGPFGSNLKTAHYTAEGPRVIRLQNVGDGIFVDEEAHISEEHFQRLQKHRIFEGDVVIAALGKNPPRSCLIPESVGPAIVKADCIRFKPHADIVAKYANFALSSDSVRKRTENIVHGVGRPRLNLSEIKSILLPLPPLAEQLRIVAEIERRLSMVDEVETVVSTELLRALRLRQSILQRAFAEGVDATARICSPERVMTDSSLALWLK